MSNPENTPLAIQASPQEAEWWLPRHQQKLLEKSAMESVNLVFLGDSITHAWEDKGLPVWQELYQPRGGLNLGFSGDRTEHVLWRIANGELDGIAPKVLVLWSERTIQAIVRIQQKRLRLGWNAFSHS